MKLRYCIRAGKSELDDACFANNRLTISDHFEA